MLMGKYIGGRNLGRAIRISPNALLYDLTGRSEGSRNRVIEVMSDPAFPVSLMVRSRSKLTPEESAILEYPCIIKASGNYPEGFVIGNGVHTIDIAYGLPSSGENTEEITKRVLKLMEDALQNHGVEPDGYTPRIAGVAIRSKENEEEFEKAWLGIIYPETPGDKEYGAIKVFEVDFHEAEFAGIATYKANDSSLDPSQGELRTLNDHGTFPVASAQALAEWEYERLKQFSVTTENGEEVDTRVATAALVLGKGGDSDCHIGICNRHTVRG